MVDKDLAEFVVFRAMGVESDEENVQLIEASGDVADLLVQRHQ
jgi:hypothetical protein